MKIVSWNCAGGLRKKTEILDSLQADVLVVQECEDPARSTSSYEQWADKYIWSGSNKNKGIGVFARNGVELSTLVSVRSLPPSIVQL